MVWNNISRECDTRSAPSYNQPTIWFLIMITELNWKGVLQLLAMTKSSDCRDGLAHA